MKTFKIVDFWVSVLLILSFAIISIPACIGRGLLNETLLTGYFVVGGWQVISMIVHVITGYYTQKWGARFIYSWISLIAIITMPGGSFWVLIFAAPFMAIYYTWLCYEETFIKMKRPMELLK